MMRLKLLILILFCGNSPFLAGAAEHAVSENKATSQTEIIIIGTIHGGHKTNPNYTTSTLKAILLNLKPAAILVEVPDDGRIGPDGRYLPQVLKTTDSTEDKVSNEAAIKLGIRLIPFDRRDRQENFRKTHYFDREKKFFELIDKLYRHLAKDPANSEDAKIFYLNSRALKSAGTMDRKAGPEIINSEAFDQVIQIKNTVRDQLLPAIAKKHPGYEEMAKTAQFIDAEWQERNQIMVDNILRTAASFQGKRLVVTTGAEHRYILRDLLSKHEGIALKEYWEVLPQASQH